MMSKSGQCIAFGMWIALAAALGCEKDYRPQDVELAKVKAAVKSLSHDDFDKLTSTEKFEFLDIVTKTHGIPYLTGPSDVRFEVSTRPGAYEESLFKLHETEKVVAFLDAELTSHLDAAPKVMTGDDATLKNRELRLVNRLATDYLQALVVNHMPTEYRTYKEIAGPNAPDPYTIADAKLVNTADTGAVQIYMAAAREGDPVKMTEARKKIDEVLSSFKNKTVDFTPPKVRPDMRPDPGL